MRLFSKLFTLLGPFLLILLIFSCQTDSGRKNPPKAVKGVLDLTGWNFKTDGSLNLDGEWKLYWNQLLNETNLQGPHPPVETGFFVVPNNWSGMQIADQRLPSFGYATFILEIRTNHVAHELALKIQNMGTAYRLLVNNEVVSQNGRVGTSRETMKPEFRPTVVDFVAPGNRFQLVLQISNYYDQRGGPWASIRLGDEDTIRSEHEHLLLFETFLIGCLFIMFVYHLALFSLRKEDTSTLYFSFFCLLITLRALITNERFLFQLIPFLSWEAGLSLEFLTFYLAVPVFAMYLWSLYPDEFNRKVLRFIQGIGVVYSLVVVFTPVRIFSYTLQTYQAFTLVTGAYIFFVIGLAFKRKREGTWVILTGFFLLFASVVNDILYANDIVNTGHTVSFGLFLFIFSQAYLLSDRFAKAFKLVDSQKSQLERTNEALQHEITERQKLTISLGESHRKFQDSRVALILGLAKLAEYRDEDTGLHLERMREYTKILAKELARRASYHGYITEEYILDIYQSAILHDIGKVGIKDSILLKPGKLTEDEFRIMQNHASIGGDAIRQVESKIKVQSFLRLGRDIAYSHHEKWDGSGYPRGLKGDDIPLSARVVALADVYDALTSERPYKQAFSHEKSTEIIRNDAGRHFDPEVVDAFLAQIKMFNSVRKTMQG